MVYLYIQHNNLKPKNYPHGKDSRFLPSIDFRFWISSRFCANDFLEIFASDV